MKFEDACKEMDRAVTALGLELPEPVWMDVIKRWDNVRNSLRRTTSHDLPIHDPEFNWFDPIWVNKDVS